MRKTVFITLLLGSNAVQAGVGEVAVDSSSFMRSSTLRGLSATTLSIKADFKTERTLIDSRLNIVLNTFAEKPDAVTPQIYDSHLSLNPKVGGPHGVTLGRRRYEWSMADDYWQMGLFSPRFLWDPLKPEKVGLTGLFYTLNTQSWKVLAFVSPLSEPERGSPLTTEGGKFVAASPFNPPLPSAVNVQGAIAPIRYDLDFPPINDLLMNFGSGISMGYEPSQGFWGRVSYAYLPIHQADILVDAKLNTANFELEARIVPRIRRHHIAQTEFGYRVGGLGLWASLGGEYPVSVETSDEFIRNPIGPALMMMGGISYEARPLTLSMGYLRIKEDVSKDAVESEFEITVPPRFPYTQALKGNILVDLGTRFTYSAEAIHDFPNRSTMLSADIHYYPGRNSSSHVAGRWKVGVGTDWFVSRSGEGWFGQYKGNDRVRGRVSYAF